jgi:uncharacterized protein (TIGR02217 family)
MVDFLDMRFPVSVSYGATGGPGFMTSVLPLTSGREKRNVNWEAERARYNAARGIESDDQKAEIQAFFRIARGKAYGWRYKDWNDFDLARQEIGTGDGSTVAFQLFKRYAFGAYTHDRVLAKIVDGTVTVWVDDVAITGWSLDYDTGILTLDAAATTGDSIEAACEFDVPCRFDTDNLDISRDAEAFWQWGSIPIVEVRETDGS